jgi:hypothetical protein
MVASAEILPATISDALYRAISQFYRHCAEKISRVTSAWLIHGGNDASLQVDNERQLWRGLDV